MTQRARRSQHFSPVELLVLQPTPFCNLDCSYCYLPSRSDRHRMGFETLEAIFKTVFGEDLAAPELTVVWHAGEPMVLPISYYREAFERIEKLRPPAVRVTHSFQTNGTLLTDAWCEFIGEAGIRFGISIDGPEAIHDACRKTRSGGGTFQRVVRGIERVRAHGLDFHVISVLTRESLGFPDELFQFYKSQGIRQVAFNVEEREGVHTQSSLEEPDTVARFRSFLSRFVQLMLRDGRDMQLRELQAVLQAIRHSDQPIQNPQNTPLSILTVDSHGRFTTFSPELLGFSSPIHGDFTLGDARDGSILAALETPRFRAIAAEIVAGERRCRETCGYFRICGGGAPANKLFEHGRLDAAQTLYCTLTKQVVADVALDLIEGSGASIPGMAPEATLEK